MNLTIFLILSLATWRISSLLTNPDEHGPYNILDRFRELVGVRYEGENGYAFNEFGEVLLCLWCTSIWVSLIIAILSIPLYTTWLLVFPVALALSTSAIIIERVVNG